MKRVMSVSIGSSKRDHTVEVVLLGERILIQRVGTDGSMEKAISLIRQWDGKVDAFGMGGIDLYLMAGGRRYVIRDAKRLARAAQNTPIVDGSGLKNTLERRVVQQLAASGFPLEGRKTLLVCGLDRFGMAEALTSAGCDMIFGDFMFALGIPFALRSLRGLHIAASLIAPVAVQLPFEMLYPTGGSQETIKPKYTAYYDWADIVAGDFHFIRKHMPEKLTGKTILTNTVTSADVAELQQRGVSVLITTTPELDGRSFGTNVMEAVFVALAGKPAAQLTPADYQDMLERAGFKPRIEYLQDSSGRSATIRRAGSVWSSLHM